MYLSINAWNLYYDMVSSLISWLVSSSFYGLVNVNPHILNVTDEFQSWVNICAVNACFAIIDINERSAQFNWNADFKRIRKMKLMSYKCSPHQLHNDR